MNSLEKFKKRMEMKGSSVVESVANRSRRVLDDMFSTSPSYHIVEVDGEKVESIIHRTNQYNIKQIHFKYDYEVNVGSIIAYEDKMYLLLEKDKDVLNSFAKMEECNSTIEVQVGESERVKIGEDERGRPIYDHITKYKNEPCIIRDKYYSSNDNSQLPLPEGKLDILLKYQDASNLVVNYEFNIQKKDYKVSDLSYVDVVNEVGVMKIHAERREDKIE